MTGLRELLMRFRPVSTPGPAATGVPADRAAELAAELTPTLALLDRTAEQAEAVRDAARHEAERIRKDAAREAEQLVAEAVDRSGRIRTQAAAHRRELGRRDAAVVRAAGQRDATALMHRAESRLPAVTERVTAEVRRQLGLPYRQPRPPGSAEEGGS
ncbi:hypothetical protein HEP86_02395 [Streptomyces sp. RPA4-5]|uniref:hypothetical protein n=1 Tax=Streptomyces TaxID=1883 RepID=UPI00143E4853|nr:MULTISPECIES: hypothetical protein [Streptomyces]MCX4637803.1 hypothetical protein [Streptomyces platensis]QIY53547.1 hypothetical protein HEP86_02395 [Streptomyces sp. RPA4-5]WJY36070.1 hypothetical protein QT196_01580 [Streptomyces sp. P9-2B-2]